MPKYIGDKIEKTFFLVIEVVFISVFIPDLPLVNPDEMSLLQSYCVLLQQVEPNLIDELNGAVVTDQGCTLNEILVGVAGSMYLYIFPSETGFSFYLAGVQNNLKLQWLLAVPMISPAGFAQIYNS